MKNEKEFLDLITLYKKIDVDWLDETALNYEEESATEGFGQEVLGDITGFGTRGTCTLCKVVRTKHPESETPLETQERHRKECSTCAYVVLTGDECFEGVNQATYEAIENAISTDELESAVDARVKHMESIYKLK